MFIQSTDLLRATHAHVNNRVYVYNLFPAGLRITRQEGTQRGRHAKRRRTRKHAAIGGEKLLGTLHDGRSEVAHRTRSRGLLDYLPLPLGSGNQPHPTGIHQPALTLSHRTRHTYRHRALRTCARSTCHHRRPCARLGNIHAQLTALRSTGQPDLARPSGAVDPRWGLLHAAGRARNFAGGSANCTGARGAASPIQPRGRTHQRYAEAWAQRGITHTHAMPSQKRHVVHACRSGGGSPPQQQIVIASTRFVSVTTCRCTQATRRNQHRQAAVSTDP